MLRLGLIGFGQQGKLYTHILTGENPPKGCVLTAISSRSDAAREQILAIPGIAYFQNWQELLESDACDAVIITVPHYLHHEIAIRAMECGKHVLCEKPITVRASDAQAMLETQQAHPELTLAMMLNQRANPLLQKVKSVIDSADLGSLRSCHYITNNWWRPDSYYASNSWRGTWGGEGGGILVNQACHHLDLWLWLCGKPVSVYASCIEGAHRNITVENDVTVIARYANGAQGTFVTCSHDLMGTDRLEISFEQGKIILEGSSKATVLRYTRPEQEFGETYDFRSFYGVLMSQPDLIYQKEEWTGQQEFLAPYVTIFENFAAHIRRGTPLIAPAQAGLDQTELANAIQLSGWLRKEVSLPCDSEQFNARLKEKIRQETT